MFFILAHKAVSRHFRVQSYSLFNKSTDSIYNLQYTGFRSQ